MNGTIFIATEFHGVPPGWFSSTMKGRSTRGRYQLNLRRAFATDGESRGNADPQMDKNTHPRDEDSLILAVYDVPQNLAGRKVCDTTRIERAPHFGCPV
jgi:hypothetical protein